MINVSCVFIVQLAKLDYYLNRWAKDVK